MNNQHRITGDVRSHNAGGDSAWSAAWSFTTVPAIADVPILTAPINIATDIALDETLEWNMVTGADTYSLEIATDDTFSTIIDSQSGLTDPTTIAVGLLNNQTYYWHVRSHNAGGDSAWSAAWSFTTVPAIADVPTLTAPTNTATDIALDGTLEWNTVTGADTYSIEIATDDTFSTIIDSQSGLTDPTTIPAGSVEQSDVLLACTFPQCWRGQCLVSGLEFYHGPSHSRCSDLDSTNQYCDRHCFRWNFGVEYGHWR